MFECVLISQRRGDDGGGGEEGRHDCLLSPLLRRLNSHSAGQPAGLAPLASPLGVQPCALGKAAGKCRLLRRSKGVAHVLLICSHVSGSGRGPSGPVEGKAEMLRPNAEAELSCKDQDHRQCWSLQLPWLHAVLEEGIV